MNIGKKIKKNLSDQKNFLMKKKCLQNKNNILPQKNPVSQKIHLFKKSPLQSLINLK